MALASMNSAERVGERLAVQRHRLAFLEARPSPSRACTATSSRQKATPMIGWTMRDALVEELEVLGFVRGAEDVRVGRVGLLDAHLVLEARAAIMYSDISLRPPSSSMNCWSSHGL